MMLWSAFLLLAEAQSTIAKCKCTPNDDCWPSLSTWNALNSSVNGKLIHNQPLVEACYPAKITMPMLVSQCDRVFLSSCEQLPPDQHYDTVIPNSRTRYCASIQTDAADVAAGIKFAKENNIRLVIKNTGNDMVGRSQGYGGLMIWIRYIRTGIDYHEKYASSVGCQYNWTGSAFTIGGGYIWEEVYNVAADYGLIVVGGDEKIVGSIGGYLQGGGHSPAGHYFGLAADQVPELTVVLASGEVVTANECQNPDLFTALRGGGGGTYGVVISATIKAHPTHQMLMHTMAVIPSKNTSVSRVLNITANLLSKCSILSDAGSSGYGFVGDGSLATASLPKKLYAHSFGVMLPNGNTSSSDASARNAKSLFNKLLLEDLIPYNGTDFLLSSKWTPFDSFQDYKNKIGGQSWVGQTNIMLSSRMFDKASLLNNTPKIENMLQTIFTTPDDNTDNAMFLMNLVGGGKVLDRLIPP